MTPAMITLTALLLLPLCAVAGVIRVPGDIADIGAALLAAAPYDTVLVAPGDYHVNLVWPATAGIKLLSEAGPGSTVLDADALGSAIGIYTGVDTTTVVAGFTIRGGHVEGY